MVVRTALLSLPLLALAGCPTPRQALQACTDDGDCPTGMTCKLSDGTFPRMCVFSSGTGACDFDEVVANEVCVQAQRRGRPCTGDAACGSGYTCQDDPAHAGSSICWPRLTDVCGTIDGNTYTCDAATESCLGSPSGLCFELCGSGASQTTCTGSQFCHAGACAELDPILRTCAVDADCESPDDKVDPPLPAFYCANHQCVPARVGCGSNADCPSGFTCDAAHLCEKSPPPASLTWCPDGDGDGWCSTEGCVSAPAPGPAGFHPECAHQEQAECDGDPEDFPGNPERCDGKDNDCDGNNDEDNVCGTTAPPACEHTTAPLTWSCYRAPPLSGVDCIQISESADADPTWSDNHVCGPRRLGLAWSSAGPIAGKRCVAITEPGEAASETWTDNYLCWVDRAWTGDDKRLDVQWSSSGPLAGYRCLRWDEPADPDGWGDNYLCWRLVARRRCDVCVCGDGFCAGASPSSILCTKVCAMHRAGAGHSHAPCSLCN